MIFRKIHFWTNFSKHPNCHDGPIVFLKIEYIEIHGQINLKGLFFFFLKDIDENLTFLGFELLGCWAVISPLSFICFLLKGAYSMVILNFHLCFFIINTLLKIKILKIVGIQSITWTNLAPSEYCAGLGHPQLKHLKQLIELGKLVPQGKHHDTVFSFCFFFVFW